MVRKPKERYLDCASFTGRNGELGACAADPIPRRGVCGRCARAFVPKQARLVEPTAS